MSARRKRRQVLTHKRDATHPVAPNVRHRAFTATAPNTKWVTDSTYIPTNTGMALSFGEPGCVFASGGGMVDVHQM
jgi:transposase InsO family protein